MVGVAHLEEAAVETVLEAGPRGFCIIGSDGSSTCSSSSLGSTPALRLGLKKVEILGLAGELDLPCLVNLGFGPGFPLGRPEALCPQAPGTHFFQNGDPMGTQISVKWGPNGDPRQQNGDPKRACLQNRSKQANSVKYSLYKGGKIVIYQNCQTGMR